MRGLCTAFPCRGFRPGATLLMLALVALFVSLGQWQWGKAERMTAAQALLETRAAAPLLALPAVPVRDAQAFHYRKVSVRGRYRPAGQILLDNQMHAERVGYRVLTPFVIDGGAIEVMVDRGWVAAPAERHRLPELPAVPPELTLLVGTAVVPSGRHFALAADAAPPGSDARWQFLDLARYAREARAALQPLVLRLDPDQPHGFVRIWPRPDDRQERHRSYAFQWFGFAASAVAIWAWFGFRSRP
ncbi:MAG: SURF1 family protein [Pseudomonadota bacterium]